MRSFKIFKILLLPFLFAGCQHQHKIEQEKKEVVVKKSFIFDTKVIKLKKVDEYRLDEYRFVPKIKCFRMSKYHVFPTRHISYMQSCDKASEEKMSFGPAVGGVLPYFFIDYIDVNSNHVTTEDLKGLKLLLGEIDTAAKLKMYLFAIHKHEAESYQKSGKIYRVKLDYTNEEKEHMRYFILVDSNGTITKE